VLPAALQLPRRAFRLVFPLAALLGAIILSSALIALSHPGRTTALLTLVASLDGAPAALSILLIAVAHVMLDPLIVQLISLQSPLTARSALLLSLSWLALLLSTWSVPLTRLALVHSSLLSQETPLGRLDLPAVRM
jgi:hypothetical protein